MPLGRRLGGRAAVPVEQGSKAHTLSHNKKSPMKGLFVFWRYAESLANHANLEANIDTDGEHGARCITEIVARSVSRQ
jgi:hypothetical protein